MQDTKYLQLCCGLMFAATMTLAAQGETNSKPDAPGVADPLPRFVAALETEPLALIACRDTRALNEKFGATTLSKMLTDPSYAPGLQLIESKIAGLIGADAREFWPVIEKDIGGPIAFALMPGKSADEKDAPMRLVLLVQVPTAEVGDALKQQLPKNSGLFNAAELKTVATGDLPAADKLPAWVAKAAWPAGDLVVRLLPQKLCNTVRPLAKLGVSSIEKLNADLAPLAAEIEGSGIDALAWGVACKGEMLVERMTIDTADDDSPFRKLTGAIREKPAAWDGIMAATPSDVDAAAMVQSELGKLGDDRPYLFQAIERFLRGKRWSKEQGALAEALDPARFKFLSERMQGSYSLTARHAVTAELRLTLASSIKGADVEAFRGELIKGLEKSGAIFETLAGARKIGGAPPLGAAFHGRGQFAAPVVGLCPGWAWLCSSSVAYQDLTDAFKAGKTLATRDAKRPLDENSDDWIADDALRLEVNLDGVFIIGYTAWLLSSNEGPAIGSWKVPSDALPQGKVFASRRLGKLRLSASRTGTRVECRSSCIFPGATLGALALLQDAAESIRVGRRMAAEAADLTDPAAPDAPKKSKNEKAPSGKPDKSATPPKDQK